MERSHINLFNLTKNLQIEHCVAETNIENRGALRSRSTNIQEQRLKMAFRNRESKIL